MLSRQRAKPDTIIDGVHNRKSIRAREGGRFVKKNGDVINVQTTEDSVREQDDVVMLGSGDVHEPTALDDAQNHDMSLAIDSILVELAQEPLDTGGVVLVGRILGSSISDIDFSSLHIPKHSEAASFGDWEILATNVNRKLEDQKFKYDRLVNSTANSTILNYIFVSGNDTTPHTSPVDDIAWINSVKDTIDRNIPVDVAELIEQSKAIKNATETSTLAVESLDRKSDDPMETDANSLKLLAENIEIPDIPVNINFSEALKVPGDFDSLNRRSIWWDDVSRQIGFISDIEQPYDVRTQRNEMRRSFIATMDNRDNRTAIGQASDHNLVRKRNIDREVTDFMIENIPLKRTCTNTSRTDNASLQASLASLASYSNEYRQPRNNSDLLFGQEFYINGEPRSLMNMFY